uniref:Uncharacterized protein n=1 Tax=Anguilla anguilla TaxID=7936 RepID=A0A0E9QY51_ANGAN
MYSGQCQFSQVQPCATTEVWPLHLSPFGKLTFGKLTCSTFIIY